MGKRRISVPEAARELAGVASETCIYRLVWSGKVESEKVGRYTFLSERSLEQIRKLRTK